MAKKDFNSLDSVLKGIQKDYGKDVVRNKDTMPVIERWDIESLKLANVFGGGLPKGRIIELYGPESSGKTTMTLFLAAGIQKQGGFIIFIDAEFAFDYGFAEKLGVDVSEEKFMLIRPDSGEQAWDIADRMVRTGQVDLIIIDSVSALVPTAEDNGDYGDSHVGLQARMMSQGCRKITKIVGNSKTSIMFINQIRCLDENTDIVINGFLDKIKNVKLGDIVNNKKVEDIFNQEKINGKLVITNNKPDLHISYNHRQPIISNKEGKYILEKGENIKIKDWLLQPIQENILNEDKPYIDLSDLIKKIDIPKNAKDFKLPNILNEDLAFFMGYYYADGCLRYYNHSNYGVWFSEKNIERFSLIKENLEILFPNVYKITGDNLYIVGKKIYEFCKILGLKRYGKNKVIPELILKSNINVIKSFIRGAFFDTHGFNKKGFIFTNENNESIYQFSNLLYNMGIFSNVRKGRLNNKHLSMSITGEDAVKFNKLIGFAEKSKSIKANDFTFINNARGKYDVIPYKFALNILKEVKKYNKNKNLTDFYKYNNLNMCKHKKLNFCRKTFIEFLDYIDFHKYNEIIYNNRFIEIIDIKDKIINKAVDIQLEGNPLFIANQYLTHNSKIGVMFGSPDTTSGGNALKFYASIRFEVRRGEVIKDKDNAIGHIIKVKNIKNKTAPPFRKEELTFYFDSGINTDCEYLDFGVEYGIIEKSGAWYSYGEERLGQGKENVYQYFKDNPKVFEEIKKQVREIFFNGKQEEKEVKEKKSKKKTSKKKNEEIELEI